MPLPALKMGITRMHLAKRRTALGGCAIAIVLGAIAGPDRAHAQHDGFEIRNQVAGEQFNPHRRGYRHYARRFWVPSYYVSNYHPYFYYTPLHYFAPPPGIRYYGPAPGLWWR
jgi:hypothetical protein